MILLLHAVTARKSQQKHHTRQSIKLLLHALLARSKQQKPHARQTLRIWDFFAHGDSKKQAVRTSYRAGRRGNRRQFAAAQQGGLRAVRARLQGAVHAQRLHGEDEGEDAEQRQHHLLCLLKAVLLGRVAVVISVPDASLHRPEAWLSVTLGHS